MFTCTYCITLQESYCLATLALFQSTVQAWSTPLQRQLAGILEQHLYILKLTWKIVASPKESPATAKTSLPVLAGLEGQHFRAPTQQDVWSVVLAQRGGDATVFTVLRKQSRLGQFLCEKAPTLEQTHLLLLKIARLCSKTSFWHGKAVTVQLLFTYRNNADEQRGYDCSSVKSRYCFYYLISMYFELYFSKSI